VRVDNQMVRSIQSVSRTKLFEVRLHLEFHNKSRVEMVFGKKRAKRYGRKIENDLYCMLQKYTYAKDSQQVMILHDKGKNPNNSKERKENGSICHRPINNQLMS